MKRGLLLITLASILMISMAITGAQAPPAGPTPEAMAATKIEKVKDNLYIITGSGAGAPSAFSGGNTAVFITDAGVVLVDTKLPGWGQVILDRVKTVTTKPVVRVINTHTHGDHTGSNAFFGVTIDSIVQENTRAYVDTWNGGSVVAHPNTLASAVANIKNVDTIINGHIPVATWNDLREYADFSKDFVTWGESQMKAGKTVEQAAAEYKVPARFNGYRTSVNENFGSPKENLQILYSELKK
jgi:hypothetical protein